MSARRAALLGTLCAPGFMVVLDSNMVTVALAALRADLDVSRAGVQWVIGGYSLAFGGTLLVAGRAGDLFGRRRLLTVGAALFAAAATAAASAPSFGALIAARAVQGLGAAMALPASLALMTTEFEEGDSRNRALGAYGMAISGAFVSGVALGGALTELVGWRAVVGASAPLGAGAAVAALLLIAPDRVRGRLSELELPGALAAAGAALGLLHALGSAARQAMRTALVALAASALLAAGAAVCERRSACPLVPRPLLRRRTLAAACLAAVLTVATGAGVMFALSLYLQEVLGYPPTATGLALSLLGVAGVAGGYLAPRIARAVGLVRALAAALAVQAAGVAILIPVGADHGLALVLAGTAVVGVGHFGATVTFTALATVAVDEDQRGIALGLVASGQQGGAALGLAGAAATEFQIGLAVAAALSLLAALVVGALTRGTEPRPRRASRTRRSRARPAPRPAARARGSGSRVR